VVISPVAKPFFLANSIIEVTGLPSTSTPMAPLYDLVPVDHAVPDAAESVT